ncbi:MAG: divalent metal cation transporter [Alphaproteobacteria bacterium]|nr:divalent metal cation transporter [Alphaproteobacteria bacterium]
MLADTEAGSVITAAQSGALWGYRLVALQLVLVAPLFMAQELAARLGLGTGRGLVELVLRRYGRAAAMLLTATLVTSCAGALVTELSGLAGVGQIFGIPVWRSTLLAATALLAIVWTGSYRSVERIAIAAGLCELAFIVLAWLARPDPHVFAAQVFAFPLGARSFRYLLAANVGTCVIPWALFYQQAASVDKHLGGADLGGARTETLLGAVLCQVVTAAVVIAAAATFGPHAGRPLDKVGDIAGAFTAVAGTIAGHAVFALGLSGGALVASVVVCLTAAWALGEVMGAPRSLRATPTEAPLFYGAFAAVLAAGGAIEASGVNLVGLAIALGVLNALLLPVVLFFLFRLARTAPPEALRLRGAYAMCVALVLSVTAGVGVLAGVLGAL